MLSRNLMPGTCQIPERSGWPFAFRGAGAARFALPFGSRGMLAVGWSSHCALNPAPIAIENRTLRSFFIGSPEHLTDECQRFCDAPCDRHAGQQPRERDQTP